MTTRLAGDGPAAPSTRVDPVGAPEGAGGAGPGPVSRLVADREAIRRLARAARDALGRVAPAARHAALAKIAVLEGDLAAALEHASRSLDEAESRGLVRLSTHQLRAIVVAKRAPPSRSDSAYRTALRAELMAAGRAVVTTELNVYRAALELQSANFILARAEQQLDSAASSSGIPSEIATAAMMLSYSLHEELPYRQATLSVVTELLGSREPERGDVWLDRGIVLNEADPLSPVPLAIWDSGVDVGLFERGSARRESGPAPEDQGCPVIAWTWRGEPTRGPLRALEMSGEELADAERSIRGFTDLQACLETPAARAVRDRFARLSKEDSKRCAEAMAFFMNYAHGTHVAGVAMEGNPAGRLIVVRCDQPWRVEPPPPDDAWAQAQCRVMQSSVQFVVERGARIVNMSWNYSSQHFEQLLVASRVATAEARRLLARRWFGAIRDALKNAISGAPHVLFVTAAANWRNDPAASELIPSSLVLPNILTVGALDGAGNETTFTSFGTVDLYANGVQVESVLPGGARQSWSGTSTAAPQVTNAAAKILALHPLLDATELRHVLVEGATERVVGGRSVRLLHPRRSLELVSAMSDRSRRDG